MYACILIENRFPFNIINDICSSLVRSVNRSCLPRAARHGPSDSGVKIHSNKLLWRRHLPVSQLHTYHTLPLQSNLNNITIFTKFRSFELVLNIIISNLHQYNLIQIRTRSVLALTSTDRVRIFLFITPIKCFQICFQILFRLIHFAQYVPKTLTL